MRREHSFELGLVNELLSFRHNVLLRLVVFTWRQQSANRASSLRKHSATKLYGSHLEIFEPLFLEELPDLFS